VRPSPAADAPQGVRIDVWLWAARFFRTRSLAKREIEAGRVQVRGMTCKASRLLHVGDRLLVRRGEDQFEIDVVELAETRGPAPVAQALYRETEDGRRRREEAANLRRLQGTDLARPPKRPDKRARRLIRALGDIDAS